jgi:hypothetical protein
MPNLLLHYEDGVIESITTCELDPHDEMWILMSVLDPFWPTEEESSDMLVLRSAE